MLDIEAGQARCAFMKTANFQLNQMICRIGSLLLRNNDKQAEPPKSRFKMSYSGCIYFLGPKQVAAS